MRGSETQPSWANLFYLFDLLSYISQHISSKNKTICYILFALIIKYVNMIIDNIIINYQTIKRKKILFEYILYVEL